jgi:hypothetical protein
MMPPAQARAPAQGSVDVSSAHDTLGDEVVDLTCECGLQAVGDVARHLLVEAHRPLPDRGVEFRCAPDRLDVGPGRSGLAGWNFEIGAGNSAEPGIVWAFLAPVDAFEFRVDR